MVISGAVVTITRLKTQKFFLRMLTVSADQCFSLDSQFDQVTMLLE